MRIHAVRPAVLPWCRLAGILLLISVFIQGLNTYAAETPRSAEATRLNNLGAAYLNQQLSEEALSRFRQAIAIDDSLAVAHLNAGIALYTLQRLDEAQAELNRAATLAPNNPRVWYNLGLVARDSRDNAAAIKAFQQVLKIDPSSADAHYFLGWVLQVVIHGDDIGAAHMAQARHDRVVLAEIARVFHIGDWHRRMPHQVVAHVVGMIWTAVIDQDDLHSANGA